MLPQPAFKFAFFDNPLRTITISPKIMIIFFLRSERFPIFLIHTCFAFFVIVILPSRDVLIPCALYRPFRFLQQLRFCLLFPANSTILEKSVSPPHLPTSPLAKHSSLRQPSPGILPKPLTAFVLYPGRQSSFPHPAATLDHPIQGLGLLELLVTSHPTLIQ